MNIYTDDYYIDKLSVWGGCLTFFIQKLVLRCLVISEMWCSDNRLAMKLVSSDGTDSKKQAKVAFWTNPSWRWKKDLALTIHSVAHSTV